MLHNFLTICDIPHAGSVYSLYLHESMLLLTLRLKISDLLPKGKYPEKLKSHSIISNITNIKAEKKQIWLTSSRADQANAKFGDSSSEFGNSNIFSYQLLRVTNTFPSILSIYHQLPPILKLVPVGLQFKQDEDVD